MCLSLNRIVDMCEMIIIRASNKEVTGRKYFIKYMLGYLHDVFKLMFEKLKKNVVKPNQQLNDAYQLHLYLFIIHNTRATNLKSIMVRKSVINFTIKAFGQSESIDIVHYLYS